MLEIYTPEAWFAFFKEDPKLVIDDDGKIYTKKDYDKFFAGYPVGKIDYNTGFIYGKNYNGILASPIGKYVKEDDHDCIYGPNYADFFATPIYYIKNGAVYTPEEYHRVFFQGKASAFIKETPKQRTVKKEQGAQREIDKQAEDETSSSLIKFAGIGLVILFVIAFYVGLLGDLASGDSEAISIVLISLASCILISLFANKWLYIAFGGAILSAVVYQFMGDDVSSGFILDALMNCLLTLPLGGIVWFIRKTVDNHSKKTGTILASTPYLIGGSAVIAAIAAVLIFMYNANYDSGSPAMSNEPAFSNEPTYNEGTTATDDQKIVLKEPGSGSAKADFDPLFIEERVRSAGKLYSEVIMWQYEDDMLDKTDCLGEPRTYGSYCRVLIADDYDGLVDYFRKYYTAEATETILKEKKWKEENGKLYVEISFGLGGQLPDYEDVVVSRDSDTKYTVQIIEYYPSFDLQGNPTLDQDSRTLHLLYENGEWVWDDYLDDYEGIPIREIR